MNSSRNDSQVVLQQGFNQAYERLSEIVCWMFQMHSSPPQLSIRNRGQVGGNLFDYLIPVELHMFFFLPYVILPNWIENLCSVEQLSVNWQFNYTE